MYPLRLENAIALVRRNLDESGPNGSVMYDSQNDATDDNGSLDKTIADCLPEAANAVHLAAPVTALGIGEPVVVMSGRLYQEGDTVYEFELGDADDTDFLRLVSLQEQSYRGSLYSPYVVTEMIPEASPEGRKQLNPYLRGTWDRPRLVVLQGSDVAFRYYTLRDARNSIKYAYVILRQDEIGSDGTVQVATKRLMQNVIDYLTGMVLEIYSDQRSQFFFQKANNFSLV